MTVLGAARATAVWLLHSVLLACAGPFVPTLIWLAIGAVVRWELPDLGRLVPWWLPAAGWSLVVLPVYAAHRALAVIELTGDGTPPRLHLDIETDDVTAEIDRLIELGASVYERRESHAIMQDPAGLLFCVVPVQTGADFAPNATAWN